MITPLIFLQKNTIFSIYYKPEAAGVLMPLVVRPTVTVEVEGPLMANVEKSNLEEKILCAVLYIHDLSNGMSDLSYLHLYKYVLPNAPENI